MRTKLEKFNHILEKDLGQELDAIIAAGTINPTEVKTVTDAVCLMLKTKEYEEWLDEEDMGSSYRRGRSPITGRYVSRSRGGSYDMDYMTRRGDSYYMDAPMHDRPHGRAYDMGMYDLDYSGHSIKDRMIANLETMMDMAGSDYERQEIKAGIDKLQSMK